MKNCKKCKWFTGYSCKRRRDEDGDPIEVDDDDVCDYFSRPSCYDCAYNKDGYCTNTINELGNYVRVRSGMVCDNFFLRTELRSGLRRESGSSSSGCYLTSACVDYYKKSDDCYELTTLRKLRDEHLAYMDGGKELISQYYETAPKIVQKIDKSDKRESYYKYIYEQILKCIDFYKESNYFKSVDTYKEMVEYLKKELLV